MNLKAKKIVARELLLLLFPAMLVAILFVVTAWFLMRKKENLRHEEFAERKRYDLAINKFIDHLEGKDDSLRKYSIISHQAENRIALLEKELLTLSNIEYNLLGDQDYIGGYRISYIVFLMIIYPGRLLFLTVRWCVKILKTPVK